MKFYYQYDKERHQAKFVIIGASGEDDKIFFADKIICSVATSTVRQDDPPKFVVSGECSLAALILHTNTIQIS